MRKLSAVIVAFAVVVTACSSAGADEVGSVGETTITEADIAVLFESETLPIDDTLRQIIFALLGREVLVQGMDRDFELSLDEDAVDTLNGELIAQMEAAGATPGDFLGLADASLSMIRFNAEIGVIRQQVIDARIVQDDVLAAFFSNPVASTTVCARHILVATEDDAGVVQERLGSGEDFATVATELSLDPGSPGGDLGCAIAARYVPEFAAATVTAELGELTEPVQTDFGFHLIIVDDRTVPSEEEFLADPAAFVSAQEVDGLWADWFNATLQAADVTLDEKYGFWSPVGIVPPDRPDLVPDQE